MSVLPGALSTDQAPPLAVPAGFFLITPLAMIGAGSLLLNLGIAPLLVPWSASSIPLVHLGTLGILGATMIGALYQMTPVVAGKPVPLHRLAHGVQLALVAGLTLFVLGLLRSESILIAWGGSLLALAALGFVLPVGWALLRAPARTPTVMGMRIAVLAFTATVCAGLLFAAARSGVSEVVLLLPGNYSSWRRAHLLMGLLCWVGGLISAVSWQLLPMFYVASEPPPLLVRLSLGVQAGSLLALPLAAALGGGRRVDVAAAPVIFFLLGLLPIWSLRALRARGRKRTDYSIWSWYGGLSGALLAGSLAVATLASADPRIGIAFAFTAIWGWAALILHGMLSRIVPFLVWFHRMTPLLGKVRVPSVRKLWPQTRLRLSVSLHGGSVIIGLLAIALRSDPLARLTGLLVIATGLALGYSLVATLRTPAPRA